jgi:hypothetical protein
LLETTYNDDAEVDERPPPPSSTGAQSGTARLEELERLEEEDARSKMENWKSSVRLQIAERTGGWSLGFLETKMRKKTPPPSSSRRRSAAEGHVKKEADEGMGDG